MSMDLDFELNADRLREAAGTDENLMAATLECARAGVTTGEQPPDERLDGSGRWRQPVDDLVRHRRLSILVPPLRIMSCIPER